jgi:hypothetical protein
MARNMTSELLEAMVDRGLLASGQARDTVLVRSDYVHAFFHELNSPQPPSADH